MGVLPIRKVSPSKVALTSYYSKMFVERSERRSANYGNWLVNNVRNIGLNADNNRITDVKLANVFNHEQMQPRVISTLATTFSSFESGDYKFIFDSTSEELTVSESVAKHFTDEGLYPIGKTKDKLLVADTHSVIYSCDPKTGKGLTELGLIEDLIGLDISSRPTEYAEIGIMGKSLPIGFVLAKILGLGNLLETIQAKYRRAPVGSSLNINDNEYGIRFSDEVLIFQRGDAKVDLIMAGFNRYHRDIKRYSVYQFDKADVYDVVMERNELGPRFVREIGLLNQLWVDHITRDILIEMGEPTDLFGLLIRAVEMLTYDQHPAIMDMAYMRDKGYERIAGNMYTEISRAIRSYKSRPMTKLAAVDLNPQAVWLGLMQDPAKKLVEDSNPIHNLKEKEEVIFGGIGGRSSRTMTAPNRKYHRSNLGVVSEATVDNEGVATTTFLTADPNYTTVRGLSRRIDASEGPANFVSTSMLVSPAADRDDCLLVH